jgi:hypothetical protein
MVARLAPLLLCAFILAGCGGVRHDAPANIAGIWNGEMTRGTDAYLDIQFTQATASNVVGGTVRYWPHRHGNAQPHTGTLTGTYQNGILQATASNFNPAIRDTTALTITATAKNNTLQGSVAGGIGARDWVAYRFQGPVPIAQGSTWRGTFSEPPASAGAAFTFSSAFGARVAGTYSMGQGGSYDVGTLLGTQASTGAVNLSLSSTARANALFSGQAAGNTLTGTYQFGGFPQGEVSLVRQTTGTAAP